MEISSRRDTAAILTISISVASYSVNCLLLLNTLRSHSMHGGDIARTDHKHVCRGLSASSVNSAYTRIESALPIYSVL